MKSIVLTRLHNSIMNTFITLLNFNYNLLQEKSYPIRMISDQ